MKRFYLHIAYISIGTLVFIAPSPPNKHSVASAVAPKILSLQTQIQPPKPAPTTEAVSTPAQTAPAAPVAAPAVTPAVVSPPPIDPGDHQALVSAAGISAGDFGYVDYIVSHESGWCSTKWEGEAGYCPGAVQDFFGLGLDVDFSLTSKGYGMCQSTPGNKMSSIGADWETNPVTQLAWCNAYAIRTYGGWYGAYVRWINYHNW